MSVLPEHKIDEMTEQLEELDFEHAMNYSLADAIREGASVTDQAHGTFVNGRGEQMCALAAAALAAKARHLI